MTGNMLAAPPDVLRWSPRSSGHGDCTIAAIELACGVTYEVALAEAVKIDPDVLQLGLHWRSMRRVAEALGFKTHLRRKYDLDEDTGILGIEQPAIKGSDHVVYLWEGRIIEPEATRRQLWLSPTAFLNHYHYQAYGLLTVEPAEAA